MVLRSHLGTGERVLTFIARLGPRPFPSRPRTWRHASGTTASGNIDSTAVLQYTITRSTQRGSSEARLALLGDRQV